MSALKNLLIGILLLALPLQSLAAVTMPLCPLMNSGAEQHTLSIGDSGESYCTHSSESLIKHNDDSQPCSPDDSCSICHLACAGMMPLANVKGDAQPVAERHAVSPAPTFFSALTQPLIRPPRLI